MSTLEMPSASQRANSPSSAKRQYPTRRSTIALAAVLATGLGTPALAASDMPMAPITLTFAGEFGGQPFDCGSRYEGIGATDASIALADYRLYVSNVRLLDDQGGETPLTIEDDGRWQGDGVTLLDFEDATGHCSNGTPATNSTIIGNAPPGEYSGIAFEIGVPFELNHADPTLAGAPLNLTGMFWNWRGGYRFMRLDLAQVNAMTHADKPVASHGHKGGAWMLHVGSSGCMAATPTSRPSSCANPNRISVELEGFESSQDTIVIDPAKALVDADVGRNTADTPPGCMSSPNDPECQAVFTHLGLGADAEKQILVTSR